VRYRFGADSRGNKRITHDHGEASTLLGLALNKSQIRINRMEPWSRFLFSVSIGVEIVEQVGDLGVGGCTGCNPLVFARIRV
jgi:hypothetical protein